MPKYQTFLRCSQTTAVITFIFIGSLFCLAGCAQLYKIIGMTDDQVDEQTSKDQESKKQILEGIRLTTTELITTAIASVGAIASGFLAKWLGTEKKLTKVLITSIEKTNNSDIKATVQAQAFAAGIQPQLHTRVKALT